MDTSSLYHTFQANVGIKVFRVTVSFITKEKKNHAMTECLQRADLNNSKKFLAYDVIKLCADACKKAALYFKSLLDQGF